MRRRDGAERVEEMEDILPFKPRVPSIQAEESSAHFGAGALKLLLQLRPSEIDSKPAYSRTT